MMNKTNRFCFYFNIRSSVYVTYEACPTTSEENMFPEFEQPIAAMPSRFMYAKAGL
jgi:hypothetical protein